jgi:hypothetical protein
LFWGRVRVGVQAVLDLCENRLFLSAKIAKTGARKRRISFLAALPRPDFCPLNTDSLPLTGARAK